MKRATAEERALARCAVHRLVAAAMAYPTVETHKQLVDAVEVALVAGDLLDDQTAAAVADLAPLVRSVDRGELEAAYQRAFTLSYSEECPLYETAFSARHLFQQTSHLSDLSGFYTAFGVGAMQERPDHIAVQFEFCYLLALKEAQARELGQTDRVSLCRDAQRSFLRDHLARWAPLASRRIRVAATHPFYAVAGRLVGAVVAFEQRFLRVGTVEPYRDEPVPALDEPGEMGCPIADTAVSAMVEGLAATEAGHVAT